MVQHISTHLKGKGGASDRNKPIDADFLFYCLCRHEIETGVTVSKAAQRMNTAIDILGKESSTAKLHRADPALMEQHAWWQDYQKESSSMLPERRSLWMTQLQQMYHEKAIFGSAQSQRSKKRTSKL